MAQEALRYNIGKPQWSLIHYKSLEPMIRAMEYGAHKYSIFVDAKDNIFKGTEVTPQDVEDMNLITIKTGKENWKNPMNLIKILESLQRHVAAIMDGEEFDPESGLSHMGHVMANAMMYNYHYRIKNEKGHNL